MQPATADILSTLLDIICCPRCQGDLRRDGNAFHCSSCRAAYPDRDGVPSLFAPNDWRDDKEDVTERMKQFYEANPFPNYDELDSAGSLIDKARKGIFA